MLDQMLYRPIRELRSAGYFALVRLFGGSVEQRTSGCWLDEIACPHCCWTTCSLGRFRVCAERFDLVNARAGCVSVRQPAAQQSEDGQKIVRLGTLRVVRARRGVRNGAVTPGDESGRHRERPAVVGVELLQVGIEKQ